MAGVDDYIAALETAKTELMRAGVLTDLDAAAVGALAIAGFGLQAAETPAP